MFKKDEFQILPWQNPYLLWWQAKLEQNNLPQALLLIAPQGSGKSILAAKFAQLAFCENALTSLNCDTCANCKLVISGNYPDLLVIEPQNKNIVIEQVRDLIDSAMQSGARSERKIIIIKQAHTMNASAANAILKILEEPPEGTSFIFLSEKPKLLPATILSRMQKLVLSKPDFNQALTWLEQNGVENAEQKLKENFGMPLLALAADFSPLTATKELMQNLIANLIDKNTNVLQASASISADIELNAIIEVLQRLIQTALKVLIMQEYNYSNIAFYQKWLANTNSYKLVELYATTTKATARLNTNPNKALFLEALFIDIEQSLV